MPDRYAKFAVAQPPWLIWNVPIHVHRAAIRERGCGRGRRADAMVPVKPEPEVTAELHVTDAPALALKRSRK